VEHITNTALAERIVAIRRGCKGAAVRRRRFLVEMALKASSSDFKVKISRPANYAKTPGIPAKPV
jgi:hypothetical protein